MENLTADGQKKKGMIFRSCVRSSIDMIVLGRTSKYDVPGTRRLVYFCESVVASCLWSSMQ